MIRCLHRYGFMSFDELFVEVSKIVPAPAPRDHLDRLPPLPKVSIPKLKVALALSGVALTTKELECLAASFQGDGHIDLVSSNKYGVFSSSNRRIWP